MVFARSYPLAGAVFIVFPCPYLIVFSPFSLTSCAAFPCFIGFLFVSLTRFARLRSSSFVCLLAWAWALSLSVRSRLVSRLGIRVVERGGVACSVVWEIIP